MQRFDPTQIDKYNIAAEDKVQDKLLTDEVLKKALHADIEEYKAKYVRAITDYKGRRATLEENTNFTYFRTLYIALLNKALEENPKISEELKKLRETQPEKATISLDELLGEKGKELYKLALEEEKHSEAYRDALLNKSTTQHKGKRWKQKLVAVVGGPSGSGKSKAAQKAIEKAQENIEKDELSSTGTINYVVASDGGLARETSQIYKATIRAANILGYTGVSDLAGASKSIGKTKNYLRDMALHESFQHGVVIPNTFTKHGILPSFAEKITGLDIKENKLLKMILALDRDKTKIVFCLVDGKEKQNFKAIVAYLGSRRAWKTRWPTDESISTDLNDTKDLSESKAYLEDNFWYGVDGSAKAYKYLEAKIGEGFYGIKIINDLIFLKQDAANPNNWLRLDAYEEGALVVSENLFNDWKSNPEGKELADYIKDKYNPPIVLSAAFDLFKQHIDLLRRIESLEEKDSKKEKDLSELKELKAIDQKIKLILSGDASVNLPQIQQQLAELLKDRKESLGDSKGIVRGISKSVSALNASRAKLEESSPSMSTSSGSRSDSESEEKTSPPATPKIVIASASSATSSASQTPQEKLADPIKEVQISEAKFVSFMRDFINACEKCMVTLSDTEQEKMARFLVPFKYFAKNPASQALMTAPYDEILPQFEKLIDDKELLLHAESFAISAATGRSEFLIFLRKLAWTKPDFYSNLLTVYNRMAAVHARPPIMTFVDIIAMPWQRIGRYCMPLEHAESVIAKLSNEQRDKLDAELIQKVADLSKKAKSIPLKANKRVAEIQDKITAQQSDHQKSLQKHFEEMNSKFKSTLDDLIADIKATTPGDRAGHPQLINLLTQLDGARQYLNDLKFDGTHENILPIIAEFNAILTAIKKQETSYTGVEAKEVKKLVKTAREKLSSLVKDNQLEKDLDNFNKHAKEAIKGFRKAINDSSQPELDDLTRNRLGILRPAAVEMYPSAEAPRPVEIRLLGAKAGSVFSADVPVKKHEKVRIVLKLVDNNKARERFDQNKNKVAKSFLTTVYLTKEYVETINIRGDKSEPKYLELSEYCPHGTLQTKMEAATIDISQARDYVNNILKMVAAFNKDGVYFQDIKPSNLLIRADGSLAISDTKGLLVLEDPENTFVSANDIQTTYLSPKLQEGIDRGRKDSSGKVIMEVDIQAVQDYTLAFTLYELVTGSKPPQGADGKYLLDEKGYHKFDFTHAAFHTPAGIELATQILSLLKGKTPQPAMSSVNQTILSRVASSKKLQPLQDILEDSIEDPAPLLKAVTTNLDKRKATLSRRQSQRFEDLKTYLADQEADATSQPNDRLTAAVAELSEDAQEELLLAVTQPTMPVDQLIQQSTSLYNIALEVCNTDPADGFFGINVGLLRVAIESLKQHLEKYPQVDSANLPIIKVCEEILTVELGVSLTPDIKTRLSDAEATSELIFWNPESAITSPSTEANDESSDTPYLFQELVSDELNIDDLLDADDEVLALDLDGEPIAEEVPAEDEEQPLTIETVDNLELTKPTMEKNQPKSTVTKKSEEDIDEIVASKPKVKILADLQALLENSNDEILAKTNYIDQFVGIFHTIITNPELRENLLINKNIYVRLKELSSTPTISTMLAERGINLSKGEDKAAFEGLDPAKKREQLIKDEAPEEPKPAPLGVFIPGQIPKTREPVKIATTKRRKWPMLKERRQSVIRFKSSDPSKIKAEQEASTKPVVSLAAVVKMGVLHSYRRSIEQASSLAASSRTDEAQIAQSSTLLSQIDALQNKITDADERRLSTIFSELSQEQLQAILEPSATDPNVYEVNADEVDKILGDEFKVDRGSSSVDMILEEILKPRDYDGEIEVLIDEVAKEQANVEEEQLKAEAQAANDAEVMRVVAEASQAADEATQAVNPVPSTKTWEPASPSKKTPSLFGGTSETLFAPNGKPKSKAPSLSPIAEDESEPAKQPMSGTTADVVVTKKITDLKQAVTIATQQLGFAEKMYEEATISYVASVKGNKPRHEQGDLASKQAKALKEAEKTAQSVVDKFEAYIKAQYKIFQSLPTDQIEAFKATLKISYNLDPTSLFQAQSAPLDMMALSKLKENYLQIKQKALADIRDRHPVLGHALMPNEDAKKSPLAPGSVAAKIAPPFTLTEQALALAENVKSARSRMQTHLETIERSKNDGVRLNVKPEINTIELLAQQQFKLLIADISNTLSHIYAEASKADSDKAALHKNLEELYEKIPLELGFTSLSPAAIFETDIVTLQNLLKADDIAGINALAISRKVNESRNISQQEIKLETEIKGLVAAATKKALETASRVPPPSDIPPPPVGDMPPPSTTVPPPVSSVVAPVSSPLSLHDHDREFYRLAADLQNTIPAAYSKAFGSTTPTEVDTRVDALSKEYQELINLTLTHAQRLCEDAMGINNPQAKIDLLKRLEGFNSWYVITSKQKPFNAELYLPALLGYSYTTDASLTPYSWITQLHQLVSQDKIDTAAISSLKDAIVADVPEKFTKQVEDLRFKIAREKGIKLGPAIPSDLPPPKPAPATVRRTYSVPPPLLAPVPPPEPAPVSSAPAPTAGAPSLRKPPTPPPASAKPTSTPGGDPMVTPALKIPEDLSDLFKGLFLTQREMLTSIRAANTQATALVEDIKKLTKDIKYGSNGMPL